MHQHRDQKDNDGSLFCFFSGFTKGMLAVATVEPNNLLKTLQITLFLPKELVVDNTRYIQLNGVICEIIKREDRILTVSTTFELIEPSSLNKIKPGDKLSLGVLAEDESSENRAYLLQPSTNQTAKLIDCSLLKGHQHTLKFDFECRDTIDLYNEKHIGLSGSSLTVKNLKKCDNKCLFSIYAGRKTREITQFNETMKIGETINITPAKF